MRSAADSSPFFLSPSWPARVLRSCAALALAATLAACGGGDGGSAGTSATAGSAGASTSAKPDATTTDGSTATKKDDDVRYAP